MEPTDSHPEEGEANEQQIEEVVLAGFWLRVWAYLIDYAIIAVPGLFLSAAVSLYITGSLEAGFATNPAIWAKTGLVTQIVSGVVAQLLSYVAGILYFTLFEVSPLQGTLGKVIFKLKVVDEQGDRLSFARSLCRNVLRGLWVAPLVVAFILLVAGGMLGSQSGGLLAVVCLLGSLIIAVVQYPLAALTSTKQTLYDVIARTYVVRRSEMSFVECAIKTLLAVAILIAVSFLSGSAHKGRGTSMRPTSESLPFTVDFRQIAAPPAELREEASAPPPRVVFTPSPTPTIKPAATPRNFSRINLALVTIQPKGVHVISFDSRRSVIVGVQPVGGPEKLSSRCRNGCLEIIGDEGPHRGADVAATLSPNGSVLETKIVNLEDFPIEVIVYRENPR